MTRRQRLRMIRSLKTKRIRSLRIRMTRRQRLRMVRSLRTKRIRSHRKRWIRSLKIRRASADWREGNSVQTEGALSVSFCILSNTQPDSAAWDPPSIQEDKRRSPASSHLCHTPPPPPHHISPPPFHPILIGSVLRVANGSTGSRWVLQGYLHILPCMQRHLPMDTWTNFSLSLISSSLSRLIFLRIRESICLSTNHLLKLSVHECIHFDRLTVNRPVCFICVQYIFLPLPYMFVN